MTLAFVGNISALAINTLASVIVGKIKGVTVAVTHVAQMVLPEIQRKGASPYSSF